MKLHINSKDLLFEDRKITIDDAFELLEVQSTQEELDDNFIGFTLSDDEQAIYQFVRHAKNQWTLDIPIYQGSEYNCSLVAEIVHSQVFSVVRDFFDSNSRIQSLMKVKAYKLVEELFVSSYGIALLHL